MIAMRTVITMCWQIHKSYVHTLYIVRSRRRTYHLAPDTTSAIHPGRLCTTP